MSQSILIVEDNPATRKMLRLTLNAYYRVWEAVDGETALHIAHTLTPDLILQDLRLPDMDGFELVRHLRGLSVMAATPILCYSGLVGIEDKERVTAAGFTDLILKPASPTELLSIIDTYLSVRGDDIPGPFVGRHIIVVDDDPALRKLSALRLQAAGARVTLAKDGKDAYAQAVIEPPDAVLSDVLMPECDGFGLCLKLRQEPSLAAIPVVLLSSQYVEQEDRRLAEEVGANALVVRSADIGDAMVALSESFVEMAPEANSNVKQVQNTHFQRVLQQLDNQVKERAHLAQTEMLYGILASFMQRVAEVRAHSGELITKLDEVLVCYLDACGYPTGAIYLFDAEHELLPHALSGVNSGDAHAWHDFFGELARLRQALDSAHPLALTRDDDSAHRLLDSAQAESMVLCPLHIDDKPLGVLVLCSKRRQLDSGWLALAEAATPPISQTIVFARTLTALMASEQRFRNIAESLGDGVVITNEEGNILYANHAVEMIFGYPPESLLRWPAARLSPMFVPRAGRWSGRASRRDKRQISVTGLTSEVQDPDRPDRVTYTHVIHDLSTQEHMAELQNLATRDMLTQLYNRRAFEQKLVESLNEAKRYEVYGAVVMLGLDHFKQINDTLGHAAGDAALMGFSKVLSESVRETDVLARLGGDEFAILAVFTNAKQIEDFAEKILERLRAYSVDYQTHAIPLSASIGIALYPQQAAELKAVLACADQALYRAKQAGRNCYRLYQNLETAKIGGD